MVAQRRAMGDVGEGGWGLGGEKVDHHHPLSP